MISRLMVIHYPFFGGPHNQALRLNSPLRELGVETTVVLPAEPGNGAARLRQADVPVVEVRLHRLRAVRNPLRHLGSLIGIVGDVARLRRVMHDRAIDVVEVNGLVNPQAAVAAYLEHIPVVWQLLDTRSPMMMRRALMLPVRFLAQTVMTTGRTVADAHPGATDFGNRWFTFIPPVDTSLFRPSAAAREAARTELAVSDGALVVGCVANLTPQKGLEDFVRVAKRLASMNSEAFFVLLGRPMETHLAYRDLLREAAAPLVAAGRMTIRDPGDRVCELLPAFDVFLATSVPLSEGISTTVVEAMATGIPVVTTKVGALHEIVTDGETGYVVPPHDVEALANAVVALLRDDRMRAEMAKCSRRRAEREFDVITCAQVHRHAIDRAIVE